MALAQEINLLDPRDVEFSLDEHNHLAMREKSTGKQYTDLKVSLMFPLTDRESFIQITDEEENELGIVRSLEELDLQSQEILSGEIAKTYFIPSIIHIYSIEQKFAADVWRVETEFGPRTFEIVGKRHNIRFVSPDHIVIRDIDGNRYEIRSLSKLDKHSSRLLVREV